MNDERESCGPLKEVPGVYPQRLACRENLLLTARRKMLPEKDRTAPVVGVAISGGGIRSATFALGVFQAFARLGLIRRIDFLSTVSGGGYFGASLTRLFSRESVEKPEHVEAVLNPDTTRETFKDLKLPGKLDPLYLRWLRANGNYLTPTGSGDLFIDVAIVLRNWLALLAVVLLTLLTIFLFLQVLRIVVEVGLTRVDCDAPPRCAADLAINGFAVAWLNEILTGLYWSPLVQFIPIVFLLVAFPLGWGYWMVGYSTPTIPRGEKESCACAWRKWFKRNSARVEVHPLWGLAAVAMACTAVLLSDLFTSEAAQRGALGMLLMSALAFLLFVWAFSQSIGWKMSSVMRVLWQSLLLWQFESKGPAQQNPDAKEKQEAELLDIRQAEVMTRNKLSRGLAKVLMIGVVLTVFALVDSFSQTLHFEIGAGRSVVGALYSLISMLLLPWLTRQARVPQLLSHFGEKSKTAMSLNVMAALAATLVVLVVLTAVNTVAHVLAWQARSVPEHVQEWNGPECEVFSSDLVRGTCVVLPADSEPQIQPMRRHDPDPIRRVQVTPRSQWQELWRPLIALGALTFLSVLFGRSWSFLNRSSLHSMYHGRLVRSYLGASNPERGRYDLGRVAESVDGDDCRLGELWPGPGPGGNNGKNIVVKGAPLHLINVTINETASPTGSSVHRDRKGTGMAVGPCGYSAGRSHHALYDGEGQTMDECLIPVRSNERDHFRMFDEGLGERHPAEALSLGQWVAISGAAFSTGIGARTSLPLSLLLGLSNVRLGYWWAAGVDPVQRQKNLNAIAWDRFLKQAKGTGTTDPSKPVPPQGGDGQGAGREPQAGNGGALVLALPKPAPAATKLAARISAWVTAAQRAVAARALYRDPYEVDPTRRRLLRFLIPLQRYFHNEYTATFWGSGDPHWYLSDGGHFENMGAYELIRRRLPMIVIVDGEEDPDYTFEGLANLIRKARMDFNAEIKFLDESELEPLVHSKVRASFGPLSALKPDAQGLSCAHAALATVCYGEERTPGSWIVYLKPALKGDEPVDVREYQQKNKPFPQQTTLDQFYDESQWESYRRLGEHVATSVFKFAGEVPPEMPGVFVPNRLRGPGQRVAG